MLRSKDHLINFRASDDFLAALQNAAKERGISASQLIREAVYREIGDTPSAPATRTTCPPREEPDVDPWTTPILRLVDDYQLGVDVKARLAWHGLQTTDDLTKLTAADCRALDNIGPTRFRAIKEFLDIRGLAFADE